MLRIGITGGIGSGKTTVCKIFKLLDIPIFNSDLVARHLMENQKEVIKEIKALFGNEIYSSDGILNRATLSEKVFSNPAQLELLNSYVHPAVFKEFDTWSLQFEPKGIYPASYILKETALLFESKNYLQNDKNILVYSPLELRILRVQKRDGWSREKILHRVNNQMSDIEKMKQTDYIIYNEEGRTLIPQVLALHKLFTEIRY